MTNKLFTEHSQAEHQSILRAFVPNGNAFVLKSNPDSNIYKLLYGLAAECARMEQKLNEVAYEYDITQTTLLIEQWEQALGIPDSCLTNQGTIEFRRQQVIAKLAAQLDTRESFISFMAIFGFTVNVTSGSYWGIYPLPYPWLYYDTPKTARFSIVVDILTAAQPGKYPFSIEKYPWLYTPNTLNVVECLINKIKPANCQVLFRYVDEISYTRVK